MGKKVILAGGSGFIGALLARRFQREGWAVTILTRRPPTPRTDGILEVQWPARPIVGSNPTSYRTHGIWIHAIDGADALVNLAGRSVDCVPTPENRRQIAASRYDAVRVLGAALEQCRQPPGVWVQASALGFFGSRGLPPCDEQNGAGTNFLAEVCAQWEQEFADHCPAAVRPVVLRLGVVLGPGGGVYPSLARITRCLLGGAAGDGRQGISWIHHADVEEIFLTAADRENMRGVYNVCSPAPASNAEFMRTLRQVLRRPWCPAAPAAAVRVISRYLLRTDPSLVLEGQFAVPRRLLDEEFRFKYASLAPALRDLAGRK